MSDTLRAYLIDLFTRAELASHTYVASDGYPSIAIHCNNSAAESAVDAILNDPHIAVVELPEPLPEVASHLGCDRRFDAGDGIPDVHVSTDGAVTFSHCYWNTRLGDDPTPLAAALLASVRKAES